MLNSEKLYALIGERVRHLREAQTPKMSQGDLAEILDLQRTSVTNIELGRQKPTLETLLRICEHFRVELTAIVPKLHEVSFVQGRAVVVGGQTQEVSLKTASLLSSLRQPSRERR